MQYSSFSITQIVEESENAGKSGDLTNLSLNENPWGSSPKATKAIREELGRIHKYPRSSCLDLRRILSKKFGFDENMIVLSNGADNILLMIAQAFLDLGDEVIMARPTFPKYRNSALVVGANPVEIPLKNYVHDLAAMRKAIGPKTKLLTICNPNNPTGTIVARRELEYLFEVLPDNIIVVLDEVYRDFVESRDFLDGIEIIRQGKNVISVRSFSKIYGLAGIRIGYAVGPQKLIAELNRVREVFPVSRLAEAAARAALNDVTFKEKVLKGTKRGREMLSKALEKMGLYCLPSHTNFVFVDLRMDAEKVFRQMLDKGIMIYPGNIWDTPTWARITIGTSQENGKVINALREALSRGNVD